MENNENNLVFEQTENNLPEENNDVIETYEADTADNKTIDSTDEQTLYAQPDSPSQEDFSESQSFNSDSEHQPVAYSPIDKKEPVSAGVKVFSLIMAAIILITGSCTVGYLVGRNSQKEGNLFSETILDLEAKPTDTNEYTTSQVYDIMNKSVVGITAYNSATSQSKASGVIYTEDGYIITNDHIYSEIPGAKFKVTTYDGTEYDAQFVAGDSRSDLAVLKIDSTGFYPATFGNPNDLVIGENVVAVGRPNGQEENGITKGVISLKSRRVSSGSGNYSAKLIQTDAPINPGNSGGALVNMYGQVVGITSSKIAGEEYEGIGFAIPSTTVKSVVESLIQYGCVNDRTKLGISYYTVDSITKELNGYPTTGIIIAEVSKESGLYGKVKAEEIITAVNGIEITSDEVVLDVIEAGKPGDILQFTVYNLDDGSQRTVSAALLADTGSSSYQTSSELPSTQLPN